MSINPTNWSRNEQIAAIIAAVIGLVVGVIVGYLVYAAPRAGGSGIPFGYWLTHPFRYSVFWWALTGAVVGVAVIYVRRLTSGPD